MTVKIDRLASKGSSVEGTPKAMIVIADATPLHYLILL